MGSAQAKTPACLGPNTEQHQPELMPCPLLMQPLTHVVHRCTRIHVLTCTPRHNHKHIPQYIRYMISPTAQPRAVQRYPYAARAIYTFSCADKTQDHAGKHGLLSGIHMLMATHRRPMQAALLRFSPTLYEEAPEALSMYAKAITHREMEILGRKHRGGNVGNLPPTSWVIRETTRPDLLLGCPTPSAHTHHIPGASRAIRYISIDNHICTQGASLTPDIPQAHPSFLPCNNITGMQSAGCSSPSRPQAPAAAEPPAAWMNPAHALSPLPVPGCSQESMIAKNKWHRSLRDKRLSPQRLAAISSLKKKIFKRTERIGLSAAERVQVHYPN